MEVLKLVLVRFLEPRGSDTGTARPFTILSLHVLHISFHLGAAAHGLLLTGLDLDKDRSIQYKGYDKGGSV